MEMMTMMMELDKLPDPFSLPFQDLSEFPCIEFSGSSIDSSPPPPPAMFRHHHPPPPMTTTPPPPPTPNSVEAMREMIFRIAAMQPVQIDPESVKPPKRRNVKISKDPQSVAARHRRERISERIRILQRLVPGGTKMDTASMLDEAVHYMKFLKKQVQTLEEQAAGCSGTAAAGAAINVGFPAAGHGGGFGYSPLMKACGQHAAPMVGSMELLR